MDAQMVLDELGALKDVASVERVYGSPQTLGERMIIPVAEIRTCMGFGFGSGKKQGDENGEKGEGGGGGGGASARPVGVVEVTPEGTCFLPIKTPSSTLGLVLVGLGIGLLLGAISSKLSHHRNGDRE